MRTANLSDVKNDLSRYVDLVKKGGRVRILVRGVPVADIVPIGEDPSDWTAELAEMERRGIIRRGKSGAAALLLEPGPRVKAAAFAQALADERT